MGAGALYSVSGQLVQELLSNWHRYIKVSAPDWLSFSFDNFGTFTRLTVLYILYG